MDYVVYVDEISAEGETILAKSSESIPGGKGANQAYADGRGAEVTIIGAVGDDESGNKLIENLNRANVNTDAIAKIAGTSTGCAYVSVNQTGNNNIIVVPGANSLLSPAMIDQNIRLLDECSIILLQREIPVDTVCHTIRIAKERGNTVILDPAPAVTGLPLEMYGSVDIIKPNEHELETLAGIAIDTMENIQLAAKSLLKTGVKMVVVTVGSRGAVLVNSEASSLYSVEDVDVVDTTAAGDSFTAALAYALSEGNSIGKAFQIADTVSSIVVTRKGAQSSIPTYEEVIAAKMQTGLENIYRVIRNLHLQ